MIAYQHNIQPIKVHVGKSLLNEMDFQVDFSR